METELTGYSINSFDYFDVTGPRAKDGTNYKHSRIVTFYFANGNTLTKNVFDCEDDDEAVSYAAYLWYKEDKISKEVLDIIKGYLG